MNFIKGLNSIQKYQVFFFLTAILPILFFTLLFWQTTKNKLEQTINNQVHAGVILIKDALDDNYNELKLSSEQEIKLLVKNIFENKKYSNKKSYLKQALNQYNAETRFNIVLMLTPEGELIRTKPEIAPLKLSFFQNKLTKLKTNGPIYGIKPFSSRERDYKLALYYVSPIFSSSHKFLGALIVGNFLQDNKQFDTLSAINPDYFLRIYEKNDKKISGKFIHPTNNFEFNNYQLNSKTQIFQEKIDKVIYASTIIPLKNSIQETVCYLVFSISKKDEQDIFKNKLLFITFLSIVALSFVMLVNAWFKSDFIIPMNKLALAFQEISKGNLEKRIQIPDNANNETVKTFESYNTMLDSLEESNTLRTNFITTLTHDLRTPLLAQERVIEILKDENAILDKDKRLYLLDKLNISNHNLLEMVNTLLEVYEYEEGNIILHKNPIILADLLSSCFSELSPLAEHKKIKLEQSLQPPSISITADVKHLKRVFINLIANAIQNIPTGSKITVTAEIIDNNIEIKIIDNGQGIAPEIMNHMFDRYFSGHQIKKKIGSGLGLSICKTIVKLHNGNIRIDSQQGQGTTFTIKLPIE